MATCTFDGGDEGDRSWANPTNWVGGVLPGEADDVVIGNDCYVDIAAHTTIASLTNTSGSMVKMAGAFNLTVTGAATLTSGYLGANAGATGFFHFNDLTLGSMEIGGGTKAKITLKGTLSFAGDILVPVPANGADLTIDPSIATDAVADATGPTVTSTGSFRKP